MARNVNIPLILHFLFLLGFNNVKPNNTKEELFITGPLQNESRRFLWQDPLSKDWHHCLFCVDKALSDSDYLYMQQPLCLGKYDEKFSELTQYEKDERKYAFCSGKGHGEVPGCEEPQIHDNATWTCDPGLSHTNYSVYHSCYLTCDYNGEVMSQIYCNATLQWEMMTEANMSTCVPIPVPTSFSTPSHTTKHNGYNAVALHKPYDVNTESIGLDTINGSDLDGYTELRAFIEDTNNSMIQVQASSDCSDVQVKQNPATASLAKCKKPRTKTTNITQDDVWRSQINWYEEQRTTSELEKTKLKLQIEVLTLIKEKLKTPDGSLDKIPILKRVTHTVTSNLLEE